MGSVTDAAAADVAAAFAYKRREEKREGQEESSSQSRPRWECVQLDHHKEIGRTIEEWESNGWVLFTYTCAQLQNTAINHYLLFTKG